MKRVVVLFGGLLLVAGSLLFSQETTGGLVGTVSNDVGSPIAGALVVATGPVGKVSTTSDSAGRYRFPRLALGDYSVSVSLEGVEYAKTKVRVILGEATTVNFNLQQGTFEEEIMVYSDTVAIDFTESQTATSIRKWAIDHLPRGRDYTSVVAFAAGTRVDNQAGGITVDGASGLENRYVIDGIDTTDPEIGTAAIPMRAEMMEEVQIKSAGYMAEYGGALGGVINAVTRSGSNEFHGSLFVDIEDNSWNGDARPEIEYHLDDPGASLVTYDKDDERRYDPGFTLGGPILRDRWWFFASYQPGLRTTNRTVNWLSYPSDTYTQKVQIDYTTFNTTVNISSALLLKGGLNISPATTEGFLPNRDGRSGLPDQSSWAPLGTERERETYYLTADWILNDNFVISGRGGFYHTNVEDVGIPIFDLVHNYSTGSIGGYLDRYPEIPPQWQQDPGFISDLLVNVDQFNIYERTAGGIDATWFFTGAGDHSLKFGYQTEEIYNDVRRGYNADRILYYWDRDYTSTYGETINGEYGYFRLLNLSDLGEATTQNQAVFIQDAWTVLPNLTLNIGIRTEKEEIPNYGATGPDPAISFDWGDKVAPRLGFAWDLTGNARWKLYGSWGKYYDVTKYEVAASFGKGKWVDYFFTFDTADPGLNDVSSCTVGDNTIFDRPSCPAGTFIEPVNRWHNAADPEVWELLGYPLIDPDMKPMESWEAQIGLDHQLTPTIRISGRLVHKEIVRAIEDVGLLIPGIGEIYVIGNPGEGITTGIGDLPYAKPVREYDALELGLYKRFSDGWALGVHYTLSRLWGNYSGLANSDEAWNVGNPLNPVGTGGRRSPNVSRLYDVPGSMYDQNGEFVYGRLATDRTHRIGAGFLYSFDFGLTVGVYQNAGSGTPISTIGRIPIENFFYPNGRGDLGETSWITSTSLTLQQNFSFGKLGFSIGLTVLNLFDQDTATRQWPHRQVQDLTVTDEDFLTGFNYEEQVAALGPEALDTRFGMWDTFQLPREIRLTFKLEF